MFCSSYSLNSEHILIDQMSSFSAGLKTHTLRNFAPGKKYSMWNIFHLTGPEYGHKGKDIY